MIKLGNYFSCYLCMLLILFSQPSVADLVQKTTIETTESPDITMSLLKVIGGLLMVILAIFGSAWLYRRFGNFTPITNDSLKIIGGLSMGQKERVILMQVGEEQILLGVTPGRIERLHVLSKKIEISDEHNPEKPSFASQINSALKRTTAS